MSISPFSFFTISLLLSKFSNLIFSIKFLLISLISTLESKLKKGLNLIKLSRENDKFFFLKLEFNISN